MSGSKIKPQLDTPVTGRSSGFRVSVHPAFKDAGSGSDPLSNRLVTLLRLYPNVVKFRADDLSGMDDATKQELIAQLVEVLGLDAPAANTIPL